MKKLAAVLLTGFILTGCGAEESKKAVKEINVYTALENEQIPLFLENFKKHYPDIKVNITRDSTGTSDESLNLGFTLSIPFGA